MFTENKVCSESSLPTSFISILYTKHHLPSLSPGLVRPPGPVGRHDGAVSPVGRRPVQLGAVDEAVQGTLQAEDHPQLAGALPHLGDGLSEEDQVGGLQLVSVLRHEAVGDQARLSVENLISLPRVETSPDVLIEALPEEDF